jgi:hypothetical protein
VNHTILVQSALTFLGFFGKNVTFERLLMRDLSSTGYLEPLLRTGIGFYLWHFLFFTFTPCWRPCTGRTLMEPYGQSGFPETGRKIKDLDPSGKKNGWKF